MTEEDLVTVGRFTNEFEAELVRAKLEQAGIAAAVVDANIVAVNWLLSNAVGGVRVQVPASRAEEAKAILMVGEAEEPEAAADEYVCPMCGSTDVNRVRTSWRIAFAFFFFLRIPVPFKLGELRCGACGHRWQPVPEAGRQADEDSK
jgi:predicted RNA-binding Zn-ribbon protein involved in translation (DUF1610 family)